MRYADADAQDRLDALMLRAGRPLNSSGWGMLAAAKSGTFTSQRTGERVEIIAGTTRVALGYWLEGAEQRAHTARPRHKPLRWRRRREDTPLLHALHPPSPGLPMNRDEIMGVWCEAGAEALYHEVSEGRPWAAPGREVQDDFRAIVQRIIETAHAAGLEYRSQQPGVLP
jgi:hypothetical protein